MPSHKKHSRSVDDPAFGSWSSMRQRCKNSRRDDFMRYGGSGVTVCAEWASFARFISDVGQKPSALHSLDRIDSNQGYEPGNVRWSTAAEQARNRRSTRWIEHDGKTMCLSDWAKHFGICKTVLRYRIKRGWALPEAAQAKPYSRLPAQQPR